MPPREAAPAPAVSVPEAGLEFRVPAAPALPHSLELARALRPLRRRIPSRHRLVLDEPATAEMIAETQLWLPVLRPSRSRWLEVALVVDQSRSMAIWQQTLVELERLLQRHGAFRDVRGWSLMTDAADGYVRLLPGIGVRKSDQGRKPRELVDASSRRLILVVSDCTSPGWQLGQVSSLLDMWARQGPVAIIQMLPPGLWRRTALRHGLEARLRGPRPGVRNHHLGRSPRVELEPEELAGLVPVPVVNLDKGSLQRWAGMVAGHPSTRAEGVLLQVRPPGLRAREAHAGGEQPSVKSPTAAERVRRFRTSASPTAQKLATLLAAVPLSIPVMQLVWQTMLPEARQVHLAEVFLGGLLQEIPSQNAAGTLAETRYEFFEGVADILLESLPVSTSIEVLRRVSAFIEHRYGQTFDFQAMLSDPESFQEQAVAQLQRPFASASARLLRRLGGRYAKLADKLEGTHNSPKQSTETNASAFTPLLTIISHPVVNRVGERLRLEALLAGEEIALSRSEPSFVRPGGSPSIPLLDPFLRNEPLVFAPGPKGSIRLDPGAGNRVVMDGEPLQGIQEIGPEQLAMGVTLELAGRVALLLHTGPSDVYGTSDPLGMVGGSMGLQDVRRKIEQVASLRTPVLIRGETGTGKELVARAIHHHSQRPNGPFITVNLGAISKELATAEFFGVRVGAFTGATRETKGFFHSAQGGTLVLDQVDEAPPELQEMLLRLLETGKVSPVSGAKPISMDVRLIATTEADLEELSRQGRFQAPLLHRLAGYEIRVPPLRERREDIAPLFLHFARGELESIGEAHRLETQDPIAEPWLPASLAARLVRYSWPGNTRQLRNLTRQLIINNRGRPSLLLDSSLEQKLDEGTSGGTASARIPALTIISHPMAQRVGERLLLDEVFVGRELSLSQSAPGFVQPGDAPNIPLLEPFPSIVFAPGPKGGIRLDPGVENRVVMDGEPLQGIQEIGPEQLAMGVTLELAGRVALLLHTGPSDADDTSDPLGMVGGSMGLQHVRRIIGQVANLSIPVLIRGEAGTGKKLVAQAIHQRSLRRDEPFITVNLGSISKEVVAAELFGVRIGSGSRATRETHGAFHTAQGGTLVLDQVDEAPPEVQVMLLRVLETREIFPVGSTTPLSMDVRLIATTEADLEELSRQGRFQAPLLHRLAGYEIRVPPLRERREDIAPLFLHFARGELESIGEAHRLETQDPIAEPWLPASLAARLVRYSWPGNIHQLRNLTRQLIINNRGRPSLLLDSSLEQKLGSVVAPTGGAKVAPRRKPSEITEEELRVALRACSWDLKATADRLGIPRPSIYDLLKGYPDIRTAGDLSVQEITQCFLECRGNLDAMVQRLEVSKVALNRRLKELGLSPKDSET